MRPLAIGIKHVIRPSLSVTCFSPQLRRPLVAFTATRTFFWTRTRKPTSMATKSDKPVVVYTAPTPNGVVVNILLEELKVYTIIPFQFHMVEN